jgi:hypothetical protein
MRAQDLAKPPDDFAIEAREGGMAALMDVEFRHCAAVIALAFLNPSK